MIESSARVARLPQLSPSTHGGGADAHSLCAAEISRAASLRDGRSCENADTTADRKDRGETGQRRKLIRPYIPAAAARRNAAAGKINDSSMTSALSLPRRFCRSARWAPKRRQDSSYMPAQVCRFRLYCAIVPLPSTFDKPAAACPLPSARRYGIIFIDQQRKDG